MKIKKCKRCNLLPRIAIVDIEDGEKSAWKNKNAKYGYIVLCQNDFCANSGYWYDSAKKAIKSWNKRNR